MSELKAYRIKGVTLGDFHDVYLKSEADKVIAELKAREDVLVTDNRNLLDKVKMLEERLHENAEHFKRNEAQILENSDKVIAEKDKEIAELGKYIDELQDKVTGLLLRDRNMALNFNNAFKALTHSDYKQCLAMAEACMHKRWRPDEGFDYARSTRHMKKLLKLSEKFKEAK